MRALVLEHVRHEDVAASRQPIEAAGYLVESVHVPAQPLGREVMDADLLVVMGGPMAVYEQAEHPWLAAEIAAIGERLMADRPAVGVCLGSQLIAAALGARVYPGPVREVGFAPLDLLPAGQASPLRHLAGVPVLHWHGDTFDLPNGAELLALTAGTRHQAFSRGARLLALQCHPEMGVDADFDGWLDGADDYVERAGTTPARLAEDYANLGPAAAEAGRAMLAEWLAVL